MEAVVCRTVHFCPTSSLANVHCSESLVWSEVSGFCYTINTGSLPGLLVTLLLPCVMEILALDLPYWTCPITHSGVDVAVGQLKALDLSLCGGFVVQPVLCLYHQSQLFHFAQEKGRTSSPTCVSQ